MGQIEDTLEERQNWHWRNSMRPVRLFGLDARAVLPFILLAVFPRKITLVLAILSTVFFVFLERRGLTFPSALRAIRSWFVGARRTAWPGGQKRRLIDYG